MICIYPKKMSHKNKVALQHELLLNLEFQLFFILEKYASSIPKLSLRISNLVPRKVIGLRAKETERQLPSQRDIEQNLRLSGCRCVASCQPLFAWRLGSSITWIWGFCYSFVQRLGSMESFPGHSSTDTVRLYVR